MQIQLDVGLQGIVICLNKLEWKQNDILLAI